MANGSGGTPKQKPNKLILGRTLALLLVCGVVAFAVLAVKLYQIQIRDHDYYERLAVEQQTREATVTASRGTIYDRNGNVLAISATTETVFISPYEMQLYGENPTDIAAGLSQILDVDYDSIMEKFQDVKSWYKVVSRKIETELADEVRAFKSEHKYKSVHLENDSKRYYPYGSLLSHVLGFVGMENSGLEGLERVYNDYLEGTNGSVVRLTTNRGTSMLFVNYENYADAVNGYDMDLTVDVTIQNIVEKYLDQAIEDYRIQDGGTCIVMNVKTGGILAMASRDNFDPNSYLELDPETQAELDAIEDETERNAAVAAARTAQWRNMSISDTYEPGSVFKIITLAMALDAGVVSDSDSFYCGGSVEVLGRDPVKCWRTAGHGSQTLTEAVQHSCNVAFVNIGKKVGAELFYEYCRGFGLFEKTGVDLLGEAGSQWWTEQVFCDPTNLSQLAAASFGQTFNVTPIQMITAVAAAVNGGYLMEPYLVSSVTDGDGNVVYTHAPTVVRQVISGNTSQKVCEILEAVVGESGGTGKNAAVAGYRIGGKTGTTTKTAHEAATGEREYMVSFCGVAPMDDPEIAILLVLNNPAKGGVYISGGQMAAPVVGKILSEVLPYMGVEAVYTDAQKELLDVTMPKVTEKTVEEASDALRSLGLAVRVVGDGDTVTDQLPYANAEIAAGTEVILYAGEAVPDRTATVPNLYGMTVRNAQRALARAGLFMDTSGALPLSDSVAVSTQYIAAGEEVPYGTVVEVTLVDKSNLGVY